MTPSYLQKYTLSSERLGSGGAANVYRCICKSDQQPFAIKILNDTGSKDKKIRFQNEIDVMTKCLKKGIVGVMPIVDFNRVEYWYVMPIMQPLSNKIDEWKKILDKDGAPSYNFREDITNTFVGYFLKYSEILAKIHKEGFVHRDIKPKNLYVDNGKVFIGDFGIVDVPDDKNGLTKKGDRLGAWNTIAPEVLKDATKATDKSDVYSLAKSLWMCLALNEDGFSGRYDVDDPSMSLHDTPHLKYAYLVDLDDLLSKATQENPALRPSMQEFHDELVTWTEASQSFELRNKKEWNFIYKSAFSGTAPSQMVVEDAVQIAQILNSMARYGILNYCFLPYRGGVTISAANPAAEKDCIYIQQDHGALCLVRCKRLIVRCFKDDELWNYFFLELDKQPYIHDDLVSEILVEDYPAHYVYTEDWVYGVYDYDTGERFPDGAKVVERYTHGNFLFVPKGCFYNSITEVSDGRHSYCDEETFYKYYSKMRENYNSIKDDEENISKLRQHYAQNPFHLDLEEPVLGPKNRTNLIQDESFLKDHYGEIDFSSVLDDAGDGFCRYSFEFDLKFTHSILDFSIPVQKFMLCKDGHIRKVTLDNPDIFYSNGLSRAESFYDKLMPISSSFCADHGVVPESCTFIIHVHVHKRKNPVHVFNYGELKRVIKSADDRRSNFIVVNGDGTLSVLYERRQEFYPVRSSVNGARHNLTGKYTDNSLADALIHDFLSEWLHYLKTGNAETHIYGYKDVDNRILKDQIKAYTQKV